MLKQPSCLLQIKQTYQELTAKERSLADFILEDPKRVLYYTIDDFAKGLDISEATVSRFVRKLGFDKFQIFKVSLANELTARAFSPAVDQVTPHDFESFFRGRVSHMSGFTFSHLNQPLSETLQKLQTASKIGLFGYGFAAELVSYTYRKLAPTGVNVHVNTDPIWAAQFARSMTEQDVAVLFVNTAEDERMMLGLLEVLETTQVHQVGICPNGDSLFSKSVHTCLSTGDFDTQSPTGGDFHYLNTIHLAQFMAMQLGNRRIN